MQSPYYKVTPRGYSLTYKDSPVESGSAKRLPVYRVVSQFMNLPDGKEIVPRDVSDTSAELNISRKEA
jgi:hypothetical protein